MLRTNKNQTCVLAANAYSHPRRGYRSSDGLARPRALPRSPVRSRLLGCSPAAERETRAARASPFPFSYSCLRSPTIVPRNRACRAYVPTCLQALQANRACKVHPDRGVPTTTYVVKSSGPRWPAADRDHVRSRRRRCRPLPQRKSLHALDEALGLIQREHRRTQADRS